MSPDHTVGDLAAERSSALTGLEESALGEVRALVAAIRSGGGADDLDSIARALGAAGGRCADAAPEAGRRMDCSFRGTRFALTSGAAGAPVEIDFGPAEK
jgi:hypothetical protein